MRQKQERVHAKQLSRFNNITQHFLREKCRLGAEITTHALNVISKSSTFSAANLFSNLGRSFFNVFCP